MNEIKNLMDDGQRAFRLKKSIASCPKFDNPLHIKAWKAGFHSALHRVSLDTAFERFISENPYLMNMT